MFVVQSQTGEAGASSLIDMGSTGQTNAGESFADFSAFQGNKSGSTDDFDPRGTGSVQGEIGIL